MYLYFYHYNFYVFFQSKHVSTLSYDSMSYEYLVQNIKKVKPKKFKVIFYVQYNGDEVPSGTCSDLKPITSKYSIISFIRNSCADPERGCPNLSWKSQSYGVS